MNNTSTQFSMLIYIAVVLFCVLCKMRLQFLLQWTCVRRRLTMLAWLAWRFGILLRAASSRAMMRMHGTSHKWQRIHGLCSLCPAAAAAASSSWEGTMPGQARQA